MLCFSNFPRSTLLSNICLKTEISIIQDCCVTLNNEINRSYSQCVYFYTFSSQMEKRYLKYKMKTSDATIYDWSICIHLNFTSSIIHIEKCKSRLTFGNVLSRRGIFLSINILLYVRKWNIDLLNSTYKKCTCFPYGPKVS